MRANESLIVRGGELLLVPYQRHHVPRYHTWMQDEQLQEQTASEPLSIEAEYDMQQSWHTDEDKCTFVVLESCMTGSMATNHDAQETPDTLGDTAAEEEAMIGDVNLFFNVQEEPHTAEVEVMIAERRCRGKGYGYAAVVLMMWYAMESLGVNKFVAKIGFDNSPSLSLFNTKLGYTEASRCDHFREVTLEYNVEGDNRLRIGRLAAELRPEIQRYVRPLG